MLASGIGGSIVREFHPVLRITVLALALLATVLAPFGASAVAGGISSPAQVTDCLTGGAEVAETIGHVHGTDRYGSAESHCLHISCPMALVAGLAGGTLRLARTGGLVPLSDARVHGLVVPPPLHPPRD